MTTLQEIGAVVENVQRQNGLRDDLDEVAGYFDGLLDAAGDLADALSNIESHGNAPAAVVDEAVTAEITVDQALHTVGMALWALARAYRASIEAEEV
jgi:hypothetical protein